MNLVVGADAGLAGLQCVWEAADLQDQQVHGIEDFLAVHHPVSQTLQLAVAHGAGQSTGERERGCGEKSRIQILPWLLIAFNKK